MQIRKPVLFEEAGIQVCLHVGLGPESPSSLKMSAQVLSSLLPMVNRKSQNDVFRDCFPGERVCGAMIVRC
jgi:hypothetical protein